MNNYDRITQPEVLDPGDSEQSFKAITIYGPNVWVEILTIKEFAESEEKPFFLLMRNSYFSGTCQNY